MLKVSTSVANEKVLSDQIIHLKSSPQPWRLIQWLSPDAIVYEYLTNDFSLEPGVVAFLYHRRWDEEKYFDTFKNDLANAKAWGKSDVAIEQQALMGMMTYILTQLFLQQRYQELDLPTGDKTQAKKQARKRGQYLAQHEKLIGDEKEELGEEESDELQDLKYYDAYQAFYAQLSKITRQVWRFLKNCYHRKSSLGLYQRQLRPLLLMF